jgi:hypothetical protein
MENGTIHKKLFNLKGKKLIDFTIPTINITSIIEKMRQNYNWLRGNLMATILLNSPRKQVVLTILHEETEISSSQKSDSITFQVIEGGLQFDSSNLSTYINKGEELTIHEKLDYTLTNNGETTFLLTTEDKPYN